jgi:hypothetical protein
MKFLYKNISSVLRLLILLSLTILFMESSVKAQPLPPDVGIVTQFSGEATYWNEGYQKTPEKAQVFMKIRLGDYFKIAAGGMIQLVYFQNGRQETWKGPASLMVGEVQSRGERGRELPGQPEVVILSTEASQGMRRIPVLLRRARLSRSGGGVMLRGIPEDSQKPVVPTKEERAEIAMVKENYQKLRKQAKPNDITPELTLLGVLADYEQYEEMGKVIKEAMKIQPDNQVLKELDEWVKTQKRSQLKK